MVLTARGRRPRVGGLAGRVSGGVAGLTGRGRRPRPGRRRAAPGEGSLGVEVRRRGRAGVTAREVRELGLAV